MHSALFHLMSPPGRSARLSVLIFHRVLATPDPIFTGEVDAARFDAICGWLRAWHNVLPLDVAVQRLQEGRLPARALAITFDDGYADNHQIALPILQKHGLSATFFIATGFLNGGRMWNDTIVEAIRHASDDSIDLSSLALDGVNVLDISTWDAKRQAIETILAKSKYRALPERLRLAEELGRKTASRLPGNLMMNSEQVVALGRAGMGIGAHTTNHPILALLDDSAALHEVQVGRATLEALTQGPVTLFAYPNGRPSQDYSAKTVELVRGLGFSAAFTTAPGAAGFGADNFQLPRFTPWDQARWKFGLRLARNLREPIRTAA